MALTPADACRRRCLVLYASCNSETPVATAGVFLFFFATAFEITPRINAFEHNPVEAKINDAV